MPRPGTRVESRIDGWQWQRVNLHPSIGSRNMEIFLLWIVVPVVVVGLLAHNRGRSLHWVWWAVFLGWIGAAIAIVALLSKGRAMPGGSRRLRSLPAGGCVEVVGESYRQSALWGIVGSRRPVDDRRLQIEAALKPEPENPYDSWAVAVFISGRHVGYLPKEIASQWQPRLGESGSTCRGWIVGGFELDDGELASLGVLLDLQESPD